MTTKTDLVTLEGSGLIAGDDFGLAYCPERVLPGRLLTELVQNDRVLHGRRAFDPRRGSRHFEAFHVSWDYLAARRGFAARAALEGAGARSAAT